MDRVLFEAPAPQPGEMASAATEFCGMRVCMEPQEPGECREYQAKLYFKGFPEHAVTVYAYRGGAVREYDAKAFEGTRYKSSVKPEGWDDADGRQAVYVTGAGEEDLTMYFLLSHVLHQMGGEVEDGYLTDVGEVTGLTTEVMAGRYEEARRLRRKRMPLHVLSVLWCLLILPFSMIWVIVKLPWVIYRCRKEMIQWR